MQNQRRWLPRWQRIELAEKCLEEGMTRRQAAAWRRVSVATVQYWVERRRQASAREIATGSWAEDRPSVPKRQPRLTSAEVHDRVCEARRRTGWGPPPARLRAADGALDGLALSAAAGPLPDPEGCQGAGAPPRVA